MTLKMGFEPKKTLTNEELLALQFEGSLFDFEDTESKFWKSIYIIWDTINANPKKRVKGKKRQRSNKK